MFESEQESVAQESSISKDLFHFYDEFAEFNDVCAFLCDAFVCVVARDDMLDASTVQGLFRCSYWMKSRMGEFKEKLNAIRKKSTTGTD